MHKINEIISLYTSELSDVQEIINSRLHSDASQLTNISSYLSNLGGKKVRPILAISLAKALDLNTEDKNSKFVKQLFTLSAGIEMIHMATLLHDDIIDKSLIRRHKQSAYSKFGLEDTLLTGDFLLVRAFGLCSNLDKTLIEATEQACVALTEGEILEKRISSIENPDINHSIIIAQKKTAALFELASFGAAYLAQMPEDLQKKAATFGRQLGIGFQIVDDILDVISDDSVLGKPSGQDLREQKPSAINILWLETGSENSRQLLTTADSITEKWVQDSLVEIKSSAVPDKARKLASAYFEEAQNILDELEKFSKADKQARNQHIGAMKNLLEFALSRMY